MAPRYDVDPREPPAPPKRGTRSSRASGFLGLGSNISMLDRRDRVKSLIRDFGGARKVAFRLGITTQAVYAWVKKGYVPPVPLQELTRG